MVPCSSFNKTLSGRRIISIFLLFAVIISWSSCSRRKKEVAPADVRNCIDLRFPSKKEEASIRREINADLKSRRLDSLFREKARLRGFNGAVLIAQRGVIIYKNAFGYTGPDRKTPLSTDHIFQLASVSKTFTAIATLMLAERKALSLDDSVQKFFRDFPYHGIRIKDLLSHRSGLPNYIYAFDEWRNTVTVPPTNSTIMRWFAVSSPPPVPYNLPDVAFSYNNTNYIILASIIAKVSGKTYAEFLKTEIFEPLGMVHTFVDTLCPVSLKALKTFGHDYNRRRDRDFFDGVYGDKGIYSTVDDMMRWYMALSSHCLLSRHLLKEAFTPRSLEHRSRHNYGYGFRLITDPGNMNKVEYVYHGGWWAGYSSMILFDLRDDYVVIVLSNRKNTSVYENKNVMDILDDKPTDENEEEIDSI